MGERFRNRANPLSTTTFRRPFLRTEQERLLTPFQDRLPSVDHALSSTTFKRPTLTKFQSPAKNSSQDRSTRESQSLPTRNRPSSRRTSVLTEEDTDTVANSSPREVDTLATRRADTNTEHARSIEGC